MAQNCPEVPVVQASGYLYRSALLLGPVNQIDKLFCLRRSTHPKRIGVLEVPEKVIRAGAPDTLAAAMQNWNITVPDSVIILLVEGTYLSDSELVLMRPLHNGGCQSCHAEQRRYKKTLCFTG